MQRSEMEKALVFGDEKARVLLVGEAPNRRMHLDETEGNDALVIPRLLELSGLGDAEFRSLFARTNLLREWPGSSPDGKGDDFPAWRARAEVPRFRTVFGDVDLVVFVGRRAASCFYAENERRTFPWFEWSTFRFRQDGGVFTKKDVFVVTVPHPSGISSWWNDAGNVEEARKFWRRLGILARHASRNCGYKRCRVIQSNLQGMDSFPCEDKKSVEVFTDYCVLGAECSSDGCNVDITLFDADSLGWSVSVDGVQREQPGRVRIQAYGKTGSEGRVLADAFEWLAGELRRRSGSKGREGSS